MKRKLLIWLCNYSERCCFFFHWLNPITSRIGLGHCHLTTFSHWLDQKYNLNQWNSTNGFNKN